MQNPCEILEHICKKANIGQPKYFDTYVSIDHFIFAPKVEEGTVSKLIGGAID